jgi:hypothetical protein
MGDAFHKQKIVENRTLSALFYTFFTSLEYYTM